MHRRDPPFPARGRPDGNKDASVPDDGAGAGGRRIDGGRGTAADVAPSGGEEEEDGPTPTGMEVDVPEGRVWEGRFGGGSGRGGASTGKFFSYAPWASKRRASSSPPSSVGTPKSSSAGSGGDGEGKETKRTRQRSPRNGTAPDGTAGGERRGTAAPTTLLTVPPRTTRDGAVVTPGLVSLVALLADGGGASASSGRDGPGDDAAVVTCEPHRRSAGEKLRRTCGEGSDGGTEDPRVHQPLHYTQDDKWSCGFRNTQMLLSSLLPRLSAKFPHGVPSILSVQSALEDLWSAGHDPSSARHHGRSIAGTERWIGAVEVWSYLTWLGIDSVLVQFIGDRANRALLGEFCWRYFARTVGDDAGCDSSRHGEDEGGGLEEGSGRIRVCGPTGRVVRVARAATTAADPDLEKHPLARPRVTASDYARRILGQMSCSRRDGRGGPPPRRRGGGDGDDCAVPPLYLQWKGHSVTVVGVARVPSPTGEQSSCPYRLLIFCPQKKGADVRRGLAARHAAGTAGWGPKHPRTRSGGPQNRGPEEQDLAGHLEIPCARLLGKDCQILLCTGRELSEDEIGRRKRCSLDSGYLDAKAGRETGDGGGGDGARPDPEGGDGARPDPVGVRRSPRLGR